MITERLYSIFDQPVSSHLYIGDICRSQSQSYRNNAGISYRYSHMRLVTKIQAEPNFSPCSFLTFSSLLAGGLSREEMSVLSIIIAASLMPTSRAIFLTRSEQMPEIKPVKHGSRRKTTCYVKPAPAGEKFRMSKDYNQVLNGRNLQYFF